MKTYLIKLSVDIEIEAFNEDDAKEYLLDIFNVDDEIKKVFSYSKQEMKTNLENTKANITTRNFPDSVEEIRKKWKINDGGSTYCFFTTDLNNDKIVLLCSKI